MAPKQQRSKSADQTSSIPTEPSTRPPMERIMKIHAELVAERYPNRQKLAELLEVTEKTVTRDVRFMDERLNLPIKYIRSKGGYGYTRKVESFPTLQITEREMASLVMAVKALRQLQGTEFEELLRRAIGKLLKTMPDSVSFMIDEWDKAISFHPGAEVIYDTKILTILTNAVAGRTQLIIWYRKPGEKAHLPRIVDPYHIACVNGEWYLFAYDNDRKDMRTFVPARMKDIEPTGVMFPKPENFSVEERLKGSFGVYSGKEKIDVVVQFAPRVADIIRERRWRGVQELKELENGGVELHLRLSSLPEVQRWVLSYGGDARVIQPPELQRAVFCEAQRIVSAGARDSCSYS